MAKIAIVAIVVTKTSREEAPYVDVGKEMELYSELCIERPSVNEYNWSLKAFPLCCLS